VRAAVSEKFGISGNAMNRKSLRAALAALVLGWTTTLVFAQQLGTAKDARAMLDRAIAALKSNEHTALSQFNDQNNRQFHDRDLYVFCFNMSDGKVTSYSAPFLIGADVRTLMLVNDPIGQRAYDTVRNAPEGKIAILQYKMPKPGTIEPATKLSFETRIGNQGCGVTYYE
jgi:signal transduction histidine kinase